ncbi:MAG TPA: penicillin acylase family protein [Anaerolineae bacterium]|nr:penicillin acylase family protein [Anaerolineae bacterium]
MKRLRKVLKAVGLGLLVLVLLVGAFGFWFVRRPWPEIDGPLAVAGLSAQVQVLRDKWGVPHIYAQNERDLFFAQGYVHAQDRLWQMEMFRSTGNGTLSAMLGAPTLNTDRFTRTVGMRRAAEKDWEIMDDELRASLEAYSAGVNAYIDSHRDRLPVQYTILGVAPAPWTPIDSLVWGKMLTFALGGNFRLEMLRAQLIAELGEAITQELLPPYGADVPLIIPPEVQGYPSFKGVRLSRLDAMDAVLGTEPGPVWGSNDWAVHGSRTATGKPILATDTHLGLGMPAIWYENGLHGGRFNSVGFTFAGVPGVVVGHNDHIAWGVSNVNPDVEDLYLEKLNDPQNPTQYEFEGEWRDLQVITETIAVKNQPPVVLRVLVTHHGPIVNGAMSEIPEGYEPLTFRWTALDGTTLFKAIVQLNLATNWEEFRQALSYWDAPSQNFVYADVDGNIGYQTPGRIPIRPEGHQGLMPVPGWSGDYEWQGYIPYEELPHVLNPAAGFVAAANNKIVSDDYPYSLAYEWDIGYRAKRITDLLAADDSVTVEDIRNIHADTYSLAAEALIPYLLAIQPEGDQQAQALDLARAWDKRYEIDRAGASVFQVWYWFFLKNTLNDDMSKDLGDLYIAGEYERHGTFQIPFMIKLSAQPDNAWFDDKTTSQVETRDVIARRSLADAVVWLSARYGNDPAQWTWGRLHTMNFVDGPLGQSGIRPLELIFNTGPIPARGDNFTVNAGSFRYSNPFTMWHGASQRQIVDLGDFGNSLMIQATGQSGHIFHPHRGDFIALWQNVEYHPMLFDREKIEANTEGALTLTPP